MMVLAAHANVNVNVDGGILENQCGLSSMTTTIARATTA